MRIGKTLTKRQKRPAKQMNSIIKEGYSYATLIALAVAKESNCTELTDRETAMWVYAVNKLYQAMKRNEISAYTLYDMADAIVNGQMDMKAFMDSVNENRCITDQMLKLVRNEAMDMRLAMDI